MGGYIGGIYPRSERLIDASKQDSDTFARLLRQEKKKVIRLEVEANLSYIGDPLQDWDDLLRPFVTLPGIQLGPLTRFYDNNTFYRQPIIVDQLSANGGGVAKRLCFDLLPKTHHLKADLPDPFTFVDLSLNRHYGDRTRLLFDVAALLRGEAEQLVSLGVSFLQLNGPSIATQRNRDVLRQIGDAVEVVTKGLKATTYLHLYFEDVAPILPELLEFKVDGLGIDFRSTELDALDNGPFPRGLACGYLDARSTRIEAPQEIASFALRVWKRLQPRELFICPTCDLEFIPYTFAERKIRSLGAAMQLLGREGFAA